MTQTYAIFGAGPAGLYTVWRLLTGGKAVAGDTITLYEWGTYDFEGNGLHRQPAGRICSHHVRTASGEGQDLNATYIEIGGMRFSEWDLTQFETGQDGQPTDTPSAGHRLVTQTIWNLGLHDDVRDFLTTTNPLFFLRGEHFYQNQIGPGQDEVKAPYDTPGNNAAPASDLFTNISNLVTGGADLKTRTDQCHFYAKGTLPDSFNSFVYDPGNIVSNIGYWNVFYDQAGNEGFNYAADAGGYSSNVINWNAADAAFYNGEFAPGDKFKTIAGGYSRLFVELYQKAQEAAVEQGVTLELKQGTRLHSIWMQGGAVTYRLATAQDPYTADGNTLTADCAFLAMPPEAVELVAQASRYTGVPAGGTDFLNAPNVANYLDSVVRQPSYKVAMFFDRPWWTEATYPPDLTSSGSQSDDVFGPTITDLPLRQIYYFGNNALKDYEGPPVYGVLASYDDERFVEFWRQLELSVDDRREVAGYRNLQPLEGGQEAPPEMERMLRLQLAKVHYGDPDAAHLIPQASSTVFMDWGRNPFGAGYHAWAAHFDICDVMHRLRAPADLAGQTGAPVYLIGSAFSNDQAWVEGAFCTAESVLVDYLDMKPLIDTSVYKLICSTC
ncbi:flavin monoamine oxidase family protein [Thetidibacter halocola]|uniref:Amine oxidase domain-containing protein n=1 Tax=Thetidibacter halocola TaxID=2827239 RepID=A0A8J8B7I6_9RHOB|nr:hypothetical protein [Thetidibacter halocola]MBS0124457.1 hypothetical protein [Thetidibacter halocola]